MKQSQIVHIEHGVVKYNALQLIGEIAWLGVVKLGTMCVEVVNKAKPIVHGRKNPRSKSSIPTFLRQTA